MRAEANNVRVNAENDVEPLTIPGRNAGGGKQSRRVRKRGKGALCRRSIDIGRHRERREGHIDMGVDAGADGEATLHPTWLSKGAPGATYRLYPREVVFDLTQA